MKAVDGVNNDRALGTRNRASSEARDKSCYRRLHLYETVSAVRKGSSKAMQRDWDHEERTHRATGPGDVYHAIKLDGYLIAADLRRHRVDAPTPGS